ncbi:MAG: hypothetical protein R3D34_17315 [Nitratireductor sp.]
MNTPLISDASQFNDAAFDVFAQSLGSNALARLVVSDARLGAKATRRVYELNALDSRSLDGDAQDRMVAQAYLGDPDRLERLCGLVLHAPIIRTIVDGAEFQKLTRLFDPEDLSDACSLAHLAPAFSGNQLDMDRFGDLVAMAGRNCLISWFLSLPDGLACELELSIVAQRLARHENGMQIQPAVARQIVEAVVL